MAQAVIPLVVHGTRRDIMIRKLPGLGIFTVALAWAANASAADWSANIGFNSEYIFRGVPQEKSSVFGGLDIEAGGFYAGTWAADVGDGAEIDYYAGYGFEVGEVGFSVGGTWYTYTGDFDDEYLELNLGAAWRWLSFDMAAGEYGNFGGPELDYRFYSLTASHGGFHGTVGTFGEDFDGSYLEAGYGSTLSVGGKDWFDYGVTVIHSDATLLGGRADTNFVLTLSRTFGF
jgi:uncharacterized protein (TIGR02001 family)